MPTFFMFKCKTCSSVAQGPEVLPGDKNNPTVGTEFQSGKVPGLACPTKNIWHKQFIYTGKENRPPVAPPIGALVSKTHSLPSMWATGTDGSYTKQMKYPNIPASAQTALIDTLDTLLGDADARIPLLGASYDRFDDYGDIEDVNVKDLDTAEKWLTVPLVLDRLNKVAANLASTELWKQVRIDRNLNGKSADLTLPSGVDGYRFHQELLNDLVNPRGGHSVTADTYVQAIKKAIALRKSNAAGEDSRGTTRAYFFYSTRSNRGLKVVIQGTTSVMTLYYSSAATRWWTDALPPNLRLERTVA